jgi:hypothetical protein
VGSPPVRGTALLVLLLSVAPTPPAATQQEPAPAGDEKMLVEFRGNFLLEMGLTDDYKKYQNPSLVPFPPQLKMSTEERRKWVFVLAVSRVNLEMLGASVDRSGGSASPAARSGLLTVLKRIFRSMAPGELQSLTSGFEGRVTGGDGVRTSSESMSTASDAGQLAARALIREYVSAEKADRYDAAPLMEQADMLLEAGAAVVGSRPWPTAFILSINDPAGGYNGRETYVGHFLGKQTPEYINWPRMTDRQRGAAVQKALVAAFDISRRLARGEITEAEWERDVNTTLARSPIEQTILLAGGTRLMEEYRRADPETQHRMFDRHFSD